MKSRSLALLLFTAVLITPPLSIFTGNIYDYLHQRDASKEHALNNGESLGSFDSSLMSHRMIKLDEKKGVITKDNAAFAYGNTKQFFKAVKENCTNTTSTSTQ